MGVLISNRQNNRRIPLKRVRQTAQDILNALDCPDGELSVLIVDDPQIAELNTQYLNRRGPTNVIAFPMREGDFSQVTPNLLGDVVISMDTVKKEAKLGGISMQERFTQLLVHGILHLFGYDHEQSEAEARKMEKKSNDVLSILNPEGAKWQGYR